MDQQIRLFVSSTFLDMQDERNALARSCFPAARRLFAGAGVGFTEIDLRWGLPEGESEASIVKLCIDEVERCRGYFIGILGSRYGYVPTSASGDSRAGDADPSVTEIEIRRGAFAAPPSSFVRFYFKREAADDQPALSALKHEIRARFQVKEYESPEQLSRLVLADLAALSGAIPAAADSDPSASAFKWLIHQAGSGVSRVHSMAALDSFLCGEERQLRVLGPSGSGKSSLLASWFEQRRGSRIGAPPSIWRRIWTYLRHRGAPPKRHPSLWLVHCAGELTNAGGLSSMLQNFCSRLREALGDTPSAAAVPLKDKLLAFHRLLGRAASVHEGVILLIDDADSLFLDTILPFHWLPPEIGNVKLVLSGRSSGALAQLDQGWRRLEVTGLDASERAAALTQYLGLFGKSLSHDAAQCLVDAGLMTHPLALRVAADELRLAESPRHLAVMVSTFAQTRDARSLFCHLLDRLEGEHGRLLISTVCGLLACSRGGLREAELRALLREQMPVSAAQWSGIAQAFSRSIIDREGRYALHFDELHSAVQERYLQQTQARGKYRQQLIAWLQAEHRQAASLQPRLIEELPWQLCEAGDWQGMLDLLVDPAFFMACWKTDPSQVINWWRLVEEATGVSAPAAWDEAMATSEADATLHSMLGLLYGQLGHLTAAAACAGRLTVQLDGSSAEPPFIANLLNLSGFLLENRETAAAADALRLAGTLLPPAGDDALRASYRNACGNLRMSSGEPAAALQDYLEAERLHHAYNNEVAMAECRHNQALAMLTLDDHGNACTLLERCAATFRAVHDIESLANALVNLSAAREKSGKLKRALAAAREAESLARARRDAPLLCRALMARARIHELGGDRDGAESAYLECERKYRDSGDQRGEIDALLARAVIRINLGTRGHNSAKDRLAAARILAAAAGSDQQQAEIFRLERVLNERRLGAMAVQTEAHG